MGADECRQKGRLMLRYLHEQLTVVVEDGQRISLPEDDRAMLERELGVACPRQLVALVRKLQAELLRTERERDRLKADRAFLERELEVANWREVVARVRALKAGKQEAVVQDDPSTLLQVSTVFPLRSADRKPR